MSHKPQADSGSAENDETKSLSILFKRKGHFDTKRDEILKTFQKSKAHEELLAKVKEIVNSVVRKNPELLLKNRGQLAALIEGAISRTNNSTSNASLFQNKLSAANIEVGVDAGNLYEIFDEEVKQSTIGSQQLKDSIRAELKRLREDAGAK